MRAVRGQSGGDGEHLPPRVGSGQIASGEQHGDELRGPLDGAEASEVRARHDPWRIVRSAEDLNCPEGPRSAGGRGPAASKETGRKGRRDFRADQALGASHDPRPHLGARHGVHALRACDSRRAVAAGVARGRSQLRVHRATHASPLERVDGPTRPPRRVSSMTLAPQGARVEPTRCGPVQPVEPVGAPAASEWVAREKKARPTGYLRAAALTPPAPAGSPGRTGYRPRVPSCPSRTPAR